MDDRKDEAAGEERRKTRRTRWGQTAPEGTPLTPDVNDEASNDAPTEDPKAIAAKAAALVAAKASAIPSSVTTKSVLSDVAARAAAARAALDKAKRALALKKQIQEQMTNIRGTKTGPIPGLGNASALLSAGVAAALRSLPRNTPVRFDRLGRELDDEGQVIDAKPIIHSTLKININREREEKLRQVTHQTRIDRNLSNPTVNPWYDAQLASGGAARPKKKGLCFVERGFYTQQEKKMRSRLQAEALGFKVSPEQKEAQRKRDAEEEEKLNRLLKYQATSEEVEDDDENPNMIPLGGSPDIDEEELKKEEKEDTQRSQTTPDVSEDDEDDDVFGGSRRQQSLHILQMKQVGIIPDIEWWDLPLLQKCAEDDTLGDDVDFPYVILEGNLTKLVEHPVPIQPVLDPMKPAAPLTILTPKERAKLRRRKRQEKEKDKQDKIRMGLMAPPPPKVKLSNLARVLGQSAAADPSKVEKQVREQMAKRLKDHEDRNEARRLDDEARRKKQVSKWTKAPTDNSVPPTGAEVCVFGVKDLSHRGHLFKVDKNAQQYHVTGGAVLCPTIGNLIVVEGTHKALKGYKKLLLRRIKWSEKSDDQDQHMSTPIEEEDNPLEEHSTLKSKGNSYCRLLWEGVVKDRAFKQWKVYVCKSELEARKILCDRQVEHYWDMLSKYRAPTADL